MNTLPDAPKLLILIAALGLLQLVILALGEYARKLFEETKRTI